MRRILKVLPPSDQYIRQAVESGTYTKPPPGRGGRGGRGRHRGGPHGRSIEDYPIEYQILTMHPPLPEPTRVPKKYAHLEEEEDSMDDFNSGNQYDPLVKSYLKRNFDLDVDGSPHQNMKSSSAVATEDYYEKLLGIPKPAPSSFMGQKSTLLNKAYAFAVKQHEIMRQNDGMTEEESLDIVEELLAQENTSERQTSRQIQKDIVTEMSSNKKISTDSTEEKQGATSTDSAASSSSTTLESTTPSVLHNKPRTIQGMNLWSKRLQAVPYKEWTVGASVALDHWIARNILELSEETWEELLGGENPDLTSRGKDILIVRHTLFPETNVSSKSSTLAEDLQQDEDTFDSISTDTQVEEDDGDDSTTPTDSAEKTIDELLASLGGGLDDDETNKFWKDDDGEDADAQTEESGDLDDMYAQLMDELQEWRAENVETPYAEWNQQRKDDFEVWMNRYVSTVVRETDEEIDVDATRTALLSGPPTTREENEALFSHLQDEAEAEIFLQSLKSPTDLMKEGNFEGTDMEAYQAFWNLPYNTKLERLVQLGTLRPLWDEYTTESERTKFLARHSEKLLEGVELEHLVPDPDGAITADDMPANMAKQQGVDADQTYSIKMIPYGTDEYGTAQNEKARMLYQAWNTHKVNRAQYEEKMFKQGKLGLRYSKTTKDNKKH